MGEIIIFPGNPGRGLDEKPVTAGEPGEIISIADRRAKKHPSGLLGGLHSIIERIMGAMSVERREEFKAIIGGVELDEGGGRRGRHTVKANLEERWWEAHKSGDLAGQARIEEEIGGRYDTGRAGKIIERLRMIGEFYEAQNQPENP